MESGLDNSSTLVVCVGNMLMLDEGLGTHVYGVLTDRERALEHFDGARADLIEQVFRPHQAEPTDDPRVPVLDAGTMGMSLYPYIKAYDRLVIVDVIDCGPDSGVAPGTLFVLKPEDMAENAVMHSLHDLKIVDVINNAMFAGAEAQFDCICVQAGDIDPKDLTIGLTSEVHDAVPNVVGTLLELLGYDISEL